MKCNCCNKEINEGYIVDMIIEHEHYCNDSCLESKYTKKQIESMKDCSPETNYFECYYAEFEG